MRRVGTKEQCSVHDDADFIVNNECFPLLPVDEVIATAPTVPIVTLDDDEETVEYLTNGNPFSDINLLDMPEELLPRTIKSEETVILSDDEDVSRSSSVVETLNEPHLDVMPDIKSLAPKREPESFEDPQPIDQHKLALQKFSAYLSEHNITGKRAATDFPLQAHDDLLQPNMFSGISDILGSNFDNRSQCSDDIAVRDNSIELDLRERVSFKIMKKLRKQAKKQNRHGKMRREEKKKNKAKKMEKKLVVKEKAADGETAATVDEELTEEVDIRLVDDSTSTFGVERSLATPTVRFVEDVEMQDEEKEMEVDKGPSFENLVGDPTDNTVVSAGESVALGTSGISFTEDTGVDDTGGEEMIGTEVDEFSFVVGGDFDVHSSKLKTSTPHKTTDAQPVDHEVEDFFADSFFTKRVAHSTPSESVLEKGDSNEQPVIFGKSVSKPATTHHFHTSNELSSKTSHAEAETIPISDDFMQMMEEFDNDSRDGGPAELESQKDLKPAPEIAVEATSVNKENTDGKEELSLEAGDAPSADRKVVEMNEEKDESSGSSAVAWSPDNSDGLIVLDSDMEEDTQESEKTKQAATKKVIHLIVINDEEDVKWRMVKMVRGPSATKTSLFALFKLPPRDIKDKIEYKTYKVPPNIPLEPEPLPHIFAVPPPVVRSEFGPTMFGVPLDHSILTEGRPLKPFVFKDTPSSNAKKRVHEEKPKRPPLSERLGVTSDSWKPKTYAPPPPSVQWTFEDQWEVNGRSRITEREKKLQEQGVIKEYGILPRDQYQFPFDPYEGLYWPLFQPFDDVDFRNKDETDAADVKNQLTDLSVCNYISKQELLCDAGSNKWAQSFKDADRMSEKEREKNGRFANRVAYARKINDQSRDELRESDRRKQEEQEERRAEQEKMIAEAEAGNGGEEGGERLKAVEARVYSMRMQDHVRENILDEYSSVVYRCGSRKKSVLPDYWFKVPRWHYIPANDRRTYLCQLVNYFNTPTANILQQIRKGGRYELRLNEYVRHVMRAVLEANYVHQASAGYQLRLLDEDRILAKKRQKVLDSKFPVGSTVRLEDLREFVKMQDWEYKYWTFIWDCLASVYKTIPPVSLLVNDIQGPINQAFKQLARPAHREEYYEIYKRHKNDYLDELRATSRR